MHGLESGTGVVTSEDDLADLIADLLAALQQLPVVVKVVEVTRFIDELHVGQLGRKGDDISTEATKKEIANQPWITVLCQMQDQLFQCQKRGVLTLPILRLLLSKAEECNDF